MASKPLPSQDILNQLLSYDQDTGKLFWKERGPEWFVNGKRSAKNNAIWWNKRFAGKEAFTAKTKSGYLSGGIFGVIYPAHKVAWVMVNGSVIGEIDHINGTKDDNRLSNLRDVSRVENTRNRSCNSNNISGVTGVFWHSCSQKWVAKIGVNFKHIHLGCFNSFEEAVAARKDAEREYGFHENHGRAA